MTLLRQATNIDDNFPTMNSEVFRDHHKETIPWIVMEQGWCFVHVSSDRRIFRGNCIRDWSSDISSNFGWKIYYGSEVGRASTVQHSCIMIARKAEPIDVLLHNPRMEFRIATSSKAIRLLNRINMWYVRFTSTLIRSNIFYNRKINNSIEELRTERSFRKFVT